MTPESLTEALQETLALFDEAGVPRTTPEIADRLDLGRRSTYERLERLVEHGRLETKTVGASARVWWRPPTSVTAGRAGGREWPATAESLINDVLDGAEVGVFVLDETFEVAWINEATERYFGLDREEVLGRDKRVLVDEHIAATVSDRTSFAETVLATYDDNTYTERFECQVLPGEEREERWLEHRSKPIESGAYAGGRVELYYDVTDRKRVKRSHRRDREQFESFVEAVEEYAIVMLDPEGSVRTWNAGAERIEGYDADEVGGEHVSTFYPAEDRAAGVPEANLAAAAADGSVEEEGYWVRADGSRFWGHVTITAVRDEDGELEGYAKVTRDMTERRENERRLEQQAAQLERQRDDLESELDEVYERVDDAFYALDEEYQFTYVNASAETYFGKSEGKLLGRNIRETLDVDEDDPVVEKFETAMETQEPTSFERYSDPLGIWEIVRLYPSASGLSVYFTDITEQKERERQLELYETVTETVPDGVYALDGDDRFVLVNEAFCELSGYDRSELLGQRPTLVNSGEVNETANELERELASGVREDATLEFDLQTADGDLVPVEGHFNPYQFGDTSGRCGVARDVTERVERERALEESERRYRMLVEHFPNGMVALFDEEFEHTLIGGYLFDEFGVDPSEFFSEIPTATGNPAVGERIEAHYRAALAGETTEFEIEWGDRELWIQVTPVTDDDGTVFAGMVMVQDVTRRKEHERKLERQREQLAALNNLNDIVRGITDEVIEQPSREEVEATVCERLAAADSYLFAWIGDVDTRTQTVDLRTEAGVEGYLDDITITVDPDDERSLGPTGRAILSKEVQTSQGIRGESDHDPRRGRVEEYGVQSSAAIPIVHEDSTYGVLNVYAERPDAFEGREREVIGRLGEVVGHAIAAADRKRALLSDEIVELQFRVRNVLDEAGVDSPTAGTITLDHFVPIEADEYLVFGSATEDAVDSVEAIVEAIPHWEDVTFRNDGSRATFELRLSEPPVLSTVASLGGSFESVVVEDGNYQMTIHLAPSTDVGQVIDAVRAAYPDVDMLKRRQISRSDDTAERVRDVLASDLTDRQRATLEAAYHAGFFEWPREAAGEDIAASLDIASSTFHQHLRKAERKVFSSLLSMSA